MDEIFFDKTGRAAVVQVWLDLHRVSPWLAFNEWLKRGRQRMVQDFIIFKISKDVWQLFYDGIGKRELISEVSRICSREMMKIWFKWFYCRWMIVREA